MRRVIAAGLIVSLSACGGRPAPDASGEEIYRVLCANCHGADLEGGLGPAIGPGSNTAVQNDDFLRLTVTRGRGRMPSFRGLDEGQLARLIAYVREQQQP
jgi:mono/diheme cytochrome c family protein